MRYEYQNKKRYNQSEKEVVKIVKDIVPKTSFDGKSVEDVLRSAKESVRIGVPTQVPLSDELQVITHISLEQVRKERSDLLFKKNDNDSAYKIVELSDGRMVLITDAWGDATIWKNKRMAGEQYSLGSHFVEEGMWSEAVNYFDAAIHLDREYAPPFYRRAYCNYKAGAYEAAIDDMSIYNDLAPGSYEGYQYLGEWYAKLKRYEEAAMNFKIAIKNIDYRTSIADKEKKMRKEAVVKKIEKMRLRQKEIKRVLKNIKEEQEKKQFEKSLNEFQAMDGKKASGEIKKAYRDLALQHHPDKVKDKADENAVILATKRTQKINDVYDRIKNGV